MSEVPFKSQQGLSPDDVEREQYRESEQEQYALRAAFWYLKIRWLNYSRWYDEIVREGRPVNPNTKTETLKIFGPKRIEKEVERIFKESQNGDDVRVLLLLETAIAAGESDLIELETAKLDLKARGEEEQYNIKHDESVDKIKEGLEIFRKTKTTFLLRSKNFSIIYTWNDAKKYLEDIMAGREGQEVWQDDKRSERAAERFLDEEGTEDDLLDIDEKLMWKIIGLRVSAEGLLVRSFGGDTAAKKLMSENLREYMRLKQIRGLLEHKISGIQT